MLKVSLSLLSNFDIFSNGWPYGWVTGNLMEQTQLRFKLYLGFVSFICILVCRISTPAGQVLAWKIIFEKERNLFWLKFCLNLKVHKPFCFGIQYKVFQVFKKFYSDHLIFLEDRIASIRRISLEITNNILLL